MGHGDGGTAAGGGSSAEGQSPEQDGSEDMG